MDKNDWTNELRERLADYQEPVSHDLWANIEQSIAPVQKARVIPFRRLSIAAAVAALMVGGTYVYLSSNGNEAIIANQPAAQRLMAAVDKGKAAMEKAEEAVAEQLGASGNSGIFSRKSQTPEEISETLIAQNTVTSKEADSQPAPEAQEKALLQHEEALRQEQRQEQKAAVRTYPSTTSAGRQQEYYLAPKSRDSHSAMSMKLYAVNGIVSTNNAALDYSVMQSSPDIFILNDERLQLMGVPHPDMDSYGDAKHDRPVSVGLQVDIPLKGRWSVTTGVVYTNAYSEFTHKSKGTVKSQSLHYIGIPVSLNYQVWGNKHLKTYVSAGGEGDYNIKNVTKYDGVKEDAKRDRIQWSADAAVGAQYNILPQVGIYVEPGVKYYFNNGSAIENTFKDKPFNFNFQFGVRLNLTGE